ncbi:hypothetical protein AB0H77_22140 [Streptomyces sp. NPDC050844]|uniref:hypothetical protein n=1 Tax=Streptomyces sp. NPDC050844 TaxID=3155790 RepID=UPI0033FA9A08
MASFTALFRRAAYTGVELSFDEDPHARTAMVAGGPELAAAALEFSTDLPFAALWAWSTARFVSAVGPDAHLFRVDWHGETVRALSLYCRFPKEPDDTEFASALSTAAPVAWTGPPPGVIAQALGVAGPRGLVLRVDGKGHVRVALYYRVPLPASALPPSAVEWLLLSTGLPTSVGDILERDMRELFGHGPVGIVGLDAAPDGGAGALKLNPANVPTAQALRFLAQHGASESRTAELGFIARTLRARWVSYLGVRYNAHGWAGWRIYFSIEPWRLRAPGAPDLVTDRSSLPTRPLPHY